MKTWLVILSVVAVILAVSVGVALSMLSDTKADLSSMRSDLTSMQAELTDTKAELDEIKESCAQPSPSPTPKYTLSVSVSPLGAGDVSPSGGEYESGAQVTLIASPASGYEFDHWGGAASGSSNTAVITMTSDKAVIAYFARPPDCEEFPPGSIPWYEAKNHIGDRATVCGPVVDATWASGSNGKPTFLNLGESYPNPDRFTVIIWIQYRSNFPQAPENYYLGKTICVTGLITQYNGIAEIEARLSSDIEICEP